MVVSFNISFMNKSRNKGVTLLDQTGAVSGVLVGLIVTVVLLLGAVIFGAWAFAGQQDYKNNVDQTVATAVEVAEKNLSTQKDNEFLEKEKSPYKTYEGSQLFGSIKFKYPKTWSGVVTTTDRGISILMNPGLVSGDDNATQALSVSVEARSYEDYLRQYDSQLESNELRASAFRLVKVPSVLGTRLDGQIRDGVNGALIALPLRDKTIVIVTESQQYVGDLDNIILPDFVFSP